MNVRQALEQLMNNPTPDNLERIHGAIMAALKHQFQRGVDGVCADDFDTDELIEALQGKNLTKKQVELIEGIYLDNYTGTTATRIIAETVADEQKIEIFRRVMDWPIDKLQRRLS